MAAESSAIRSPVAHESVHAGAGSAGNIEARFVNQTVPVNAKASIGVFPKTASGGAPGGAGLNCKGGELPILRAHSHFHGLNKIPCRGLTS